MTNLEWIRTLSEEEFADWLYDEWLHHLQYRWSSSRGGLIIWLKDRKTEPTISKMEQVDEPERNMAEDIVESFGFKAESYRQAKAKIEQPEREGE